MKQAQQKFITSMQQHVLSNTALGATGEKAATKQQGR